MPAKAAPKKNLSALKRVRQAEKRKVRNQSAETGIKTHAKKLETTLKSTNNREELESLLKKTARLLNKAASKGIIHKNTASRKISRLTKKVTAALKQA